MSTTESMTCDGCGSQTLQIVRCDCFGSFCPTCFGGHVCGNEQNAQWSAAPQPVAVQPQTMDPQLLVPGNMPPRDYQERCIQSVMDSLRENQSTLAVKPTGTGKTVVFGHVSDRWENGRVLIMAHRDELIQQAADKVSKITGEPCDIEMGDMYADQMPLSGRARIVVTSVQTMCRPRRHERFDPHAFGLLIIDEAHHAVANTYRSVISYFRRNPRLKVLGVTATPDRSDEAALGQVFESVAFEYQITDAIKDGWLVPIEQRFVYVDGLDFSHVKTTAGDLNGGELARIMEAEEMLHKVVSPTIELAGDQPALVFASSVAHAEMMAEICNRHQPACAEVISGKTDIMLRRHNLKRFSRGEFQFLFNCAIATEGFDEPRIGVVAIARPTKSRSLYSQMVGRGTRILPNVVDGLTDPEQRRQAIAMSGKPSVLVLDFVGNSGRHKLISTADILAGNVSDEVIEEAKAQAAKKSAKGEAADMMEVIEEIQEQREAAERAARERRNKITAKATYGTKKIDPFDMFDLAPKREPGWFKGKPPSEKMKAMLEKNGIDTARMSYWDAKQLIGEIVDRRENGLCSPKQAKILSRYGESTDVSFQDASALIDRIAKNGWKPIVAAAS